MEMNLNKFKNYFMPRFTIFVSVQRKAFKNNLKRKFLFMLYCALATLATGYATAPIRRSMRARVASESHEYVVQCRSE